MSRNIQIGDKKTFDDWGLILNDQSIGYPMPKTNYIDIPHGDGAIDLTEAMTGDVKYENRTGSFTFELIAEPAERTKLLGEIAEHLHGQKHDVILPDDLTHKYICRLSINDVKTSYLLNKLVINVVAEPYRLKLRETSFGIISDGKPRVLVCENERKRVVPSFKCNAEFTIEFNGKTYIFDEGKHINASIVFKAGKNEITIIAPEAATVNVAYQEGAI